MRERKRERERERERFPLCSVAKPGKQPTPSDQQRFSLGFARYSGAAHDGRETHTRLICGTGWRLSDIYDCRSRNRNTARARSPLLIALKSPPVPGNRFRTSGEMEKKEGKKKTIDGGGGETLCKRNRESFSFLFFFFLHTVYP